MGFFSKIKETANQMQALQQQSQTLAASQGYGPQGQYIPPGQRPVFDPSGFMPPPSEFVKREVCVFCGAPKQLPSVREYLYCDFCGQLLDFDLRVAMTNAYANQDSTAYAQAANQAGPMAQQALDAGDRPRYLQLQVYLHEMRATYTKWAVPPRAWNDERYRTKWIQFSAESMVAMMFDPEYKRLNDVMTNQAISIRWKGGNMMKMAMGAMGGGAADPDAFPKAEPETFWPMVDTLLAQSVRGREIVAATGLAELDPDRSPDMLSDRMLRSAIAQGWLNRLDPDAGQELINRLGIRHEYFHPEVTGVTKGCGGCGGHMSVAPGARQIVCDGCGRHLDLGSAELECVGCGGHIVLPEGADRAQCPFCKAEVRRT